MSDTEKTPMLVAVDDGYAQIKLYGENAEGQPVKFRMRSSVRSGRWGVGSISGDGYYGLYETEGGSFTVSEAVESENTQFDGYHLSTMNRVLVNHALVEAGYSTLPVELVTGLPLKDFFISGAKDEKKIGKKRENLLKTVTAATGKGSADIRNVNVGCQAVAAWVDFALDDDLNERDGIEGAVAIVDVGGRTTDIATVIDGTSVDHQRSGTADIGVLDVYKALEHAISVKYEIRDTFPINALDKAVRERTFRLWGKEEDVGELVDKVVAEYEGQIAREVERKIGSGASMSAVVFVGGGSALFSKIAENYRNGHMADDPEFANARGLYKYHRYQNKG